jgi:hypothetical protein
LLSRSEQFIQRKHCRIHYRTLPSQSDRLVELTKCCVRCYGFSTIHEKWICDFLAALISMASDALMQGGTEIDIYSILRSKRQRRVADH